ncbi:hypothetical protein EYS14_03820 [Alteromonadaceae bacterium M269]|nr:hypothetical protein EYS14_03820 [Alteromonadaceae bacterium M269]
MKLSIKKLAFTALLFSTSTFAFTTQSYTCSTPSGLLGGNAPISEIPNIRLFCESLGGTLVLGPRNNGPVN